MFKSQNYKHILWLQLVMKQHPSIALQEDKLGSSD
jgi:hypothetical protein